MKIVDCIQYSPEWWQARIGVPTASEFKRIMSPTGKVNRNTQLRYIDELIAQTMQPTAPFFTERNGHTQEMRDGMNIEPQARSWYAFERPGLEIRQVGFCLTDDGRFGCSPDGLIYYGTEAFPDGGLELKYSRLDLHLGILRSGQMPLKHKPQVHGQLIVTGLPWVDYMNYSPGAEPLIARITPNEYTEKLRHALETFWNLYQTEKDRFMQRTT